MSWGEVVACSEWHKEKVTLENWGRFMSVVYDINILCLDL